MDYRSNKDPLMAAMVLRCGKTRKRHMKNIRISPAVFVLAFLFLCGSFGRALGADVEVISSQTPWRVFLTLTPTITRVNGKPAGVNRNDDGETSPPPSPASPLPPVDWMEPQFDDSGWGRYREDLFEMIGGYGIEVGGGTRSGVWPALLCLRTRFGVTDPAKASDLKLSLTHLGGAIVYVNGREVARCHIPSGRIEPVTLANDYPPAAYVLVDGRTPLPRLQGSNAPNECRDRYEQRIRKLNVTLPREALVRGGNVLAIELHQAAVVPPAGVGADWSHVGVREIQLTSRSGGGAIPYAQAVNGLLVWNAWPMETIADRRVEQFRFAGWKHAPSGIGAPLKGLSVGNPFDPLRPVRMAAPRGGVCSGQVVLTDFSGLKDVSAELGPLTGPGGAEIPANAVQLRYAVQPEKIHYCDVLTEDPV